MEKITFSPVFGVYPKTYLAKKTKKSWKCTLTNVYIDRANAADTASGRGENVKTFLTLPPHQITANRQRRH